MILIYTKIKYVCCEAKVYVFPSDRHGTQVSAKQRPSAMPLNNSRLPFTKWKRALGRHRRKWSSKIGEVFFWFIMIYSLKLELEKNSVQHGNWIKIKWEIESFAQLGWTQLCLKILVFNTKLWTSHRTKLLIFHHLHSGTLKLAKQPPKIVTTYHQMSPCSTYITIFKHMGVSENRLVPLCTQWFCWSLSRFEKWLAIIGNIPNIFRQTHKSHQ